MDDDTREFYEGIDAALDGSIREDYERGDGMALMYAIHLCAILGRALPDWAADAYIDKFNGVSGYQYRSWDDAFGSPHPKGRRMADAKRRLKLSIPVYRRVSRILKNGRAIDDGLFEEVGEEFGIGKTLASEIYYAMKQRLDRSRATSV